MLKLLLNKSHFMGDMADMEQLLESMVGNSFRQVPGVGALVIKDGKRVLGHCCGNAYIDCSNAEKNRDFTEESLFRIASISKQYTVYAIMQLVQQGRLDLDEDAGQYLGFRLVHPDFPQTKITVRMLASHTSGLRDGIIYCIPPEYSLQEFFQPGGRFYEGGAHFSPVTEPPGEYFCYCNLNYGLLGTIVEAVTGERFDRYMEAKILLPLGIRGGYLPSNLSEEDFADLGVLYQKKNGAGKWQDDAAWRGVMDDYGASRPAHDTVSMQNPYAEQDDRAQYNLKKYRPGTNATFFAPQGGLRMSLAGLEKTLLMLLDGGKIGAQEFLSPEALGEMTKAQWVFRQNNGDTCDGALLSYGLGLYQIKGDTSGRVCRSRRVDLVGHTGQAFGLYAGLFFMPGTRSGFAYIMNGIGLSEEDSRSQGEFSGNFIWEEKIMDALCGLML